MTRRPKHRIRAAVRRTPTSPRAAAVPPPVAAPRASKGRDTRSETQKLLEAGKLEQTCPACGRWEAASFYCSLCARPMSPADWYRNGLVAEREARRPLQNAPRAAQTPPTAKPEPKHALPPVAAEQLSLAAAPPAVYSPRDMVAIRPELIRELR
jgi:hypothetical protein